MDKIKAFIKRYKTYLALSLCMLFALIAGFLVKTEEIKNNLTPEIEETRAFITKGNDKLSDKTYKKETIEFMPDERLVKETEAKKASEPAPQDDAIAVNESPENTVAAPVSSSASFSPSLPVNGTKTKPYSVSPIFSEVLEDWRSHEAIDFSADIGSEVLSAEKGRVKFVGKDSLLGFCIRIDHGNGFETLYANLHGETTVIEGQEIAKGHIIGYVGESSLIESGEGAHLHFEMRKNGKRVNPEEYIR